MKNVIKKLVGRSRPGAVRQSKFGDLNADQWQNVKDAFDTDYYVEQLRRGGVEVEDPFEYFMSGGWKQTPADPAPWFSIQAYEHYNGDVAENGMNPFVHYVLYGRQEGRRIGHHANEVDRGESDSPAPPSYENRFRLGSDMRYLTHDEVLTLIEAFDATHYVATSFQEEQAPADPFVHYMQEGWMLSSADPSSEHSMPDYVRKNSWVLDEGYNPLAHFLLVANDKDETVSEQNAAGAKPKPKPKPKPRAPDRGRSVAHEPVSMITHLRNLAECSEGDLQNSIERQWAKTQNVYALELDEIQKDCRVCEGQLEYINVQRDLRLKQMETLRTAVENVSRAE